MANGDQTLTPNVPVGTGLPSALSFGPETAPKRSKLETIGLALQGAGAGFLGQGPQFQANLSQQRRTERQDFKQELKSRQESLGQDALNVRNLIANKDIIGARALLTERVSFINQLGGNPKDTQAVLDLLREGEIQKAFKILDTTVRVAVSRGFIQPDRATRFKASDITPGGQIVELGPEGPIARDIQGLRGQDAIADPQVQSSEILSDGTVVSVLKSGVTEVTDPQGTKLSGQDRADKIREAREFGAQFQGRRSRERALGTGIAKTSIDVGRDAFKKIPVIRKNIGNLDRVISAIDRGAGTGAVERFLPSIRAASIELDTLRNELGLDVLGEVTFGALSKGELDLSLDTALPTGLDGPELKIWAQNKKSAQEKVLKELRKAAKFFSLGGTITDFINLQDRAAGGEQATQQPIRVNF